MKDPLALPSTTPRRDRPMAINASRPPLLRREASSPAPGPRPGAAELPSARGRPHTGMSHRGGLPRRREEHHSRSSLVADDEVVIREVRLSCGLCNPAMYVAADILADVGAGACRWGRSSRRGRPSEIADLELRSSRALGGPGPAGRREGKVPVRPVPRYRNAVRDHQGAPPAIPVTGVRRADLEGLGR